jgi:hypothetical protein
MSYSDLPPPPRGSRPVMPDGSPPPPPPLPPPRSGCLTALMILIGCILLLPGLCVLLVGALSHGGLRDPSFLSFALFALLLGAAGIFLIRVATRGPGS